MKLEKVKLEIPSQANIILGIAHFIKSVEDISEALVNSVPGIKYGIGFCEASGKCLVRHEGNDGELREIAAQNALRLGAGHSFVILIRDAFPINVLDKLKQVPEVCSILCATSNPVEVIIAETDQGRGILGVIDGFRSKGIESEQDIQERRQLLRKLGYKF